MPINKKAVLTSIKEYALITLGILLYVTGWNLFLIPNNLVGGGVSIIGVLMGIFLIVHKLIWKDAIDTGWTSLMAVMLLLCGVMMMIMGLVGEYVGRIFMAMNRSPQYVIKLDTRDEEQTD